CIRLIPVVIIVFLVSFIENTYELPVFFEQGMEDPFGTCNHASGKQHSMPECSAVSQDSTLIGREQMAGTITIVDFFFTSCPSICPIMSNEMVRVQDAFRKEDNVQIYSITIDPDYDTPDQLAEYSLKYNASPDKWHFLNGPKEQTYDLV